ncbi:hypothetical protein FJ208_00925 [Candidatus Gribaldobacteria bacterium]|nr:hypothetical protein [Candidatus Gribaldobacteria bacterium]
MATLKEIVKIYESVKDCKKNIIIDFDTYEKGAKGYVAKTVVELSENGQVVGTISMRKSCDASKAVGPDFETWEEHTVRDYKSDNFVVYHNNRWDLEFSDIIKIFDLCDIKTAWHKKC